MGMNVLVCFLLAVVVVVTCIESDCHDDHELCMTWADVGECEKNPAYMTHTCRKACRVCGQPPSPYDISWATHSDRLTYNQKVYDNFMEQCKVAAQSPQVCISSEIDRMRRNRNQPRSMLNFTDTGYKVVQIPHDLHVKIQAYWNAHRYDDQRPEWQSVIHSYQNSWEAPTTMIPIQTYDAALRDEIWHVTRGILQEWSGQRLAPSAFWGIRIYHNNSILATHVDVPPRIISAIINVDQDMDTEDCSWPLEVWGHDGIVRNITMKPGDMVLYESHTIIHGRPFPFRGNYFANIFVHFEPLGPASKAVVDYLTEPLVGDIPPYFNPAMPEALEEWKRQNPRGWNLHMNDVFAAIASGNKRAVEDLVIQKPAVFWTTVRNDEGLTPIDVAIQLDQIEIFKLLVQMKCFSGDVKDVLHKVKSVQGDDSTIYQSLNHDEL